MLIKQECEEEERCINMKKVLVTGGAGYIGSVLTRLLLKKGYQVKVLDPCFFGEEPLKDVMEDIELIKGDVRDPKKEWFKGVSYVCHLGGFSNDPMAEFDPESNMQINAEGTKKVAKMAKSCGVKVFTFASSASIYDKGLTEDLEAIYDEESDNPNLPHTYYYSISKIKAENYLKELADKNFKVVSLRQGTVYGWSPRMRFDLVVNTFVKCALLTKKLICFAGGIMWRPLIDVNDVARAHTHVLSSKLPHNYNLYNLAYDNFRILDLAHYVRSVLKQKGIAVDIEVDYSETKVRSYRMKFDKIKKELGFTAKVDVKNSVENMVNKILEEKIDLTDEKYYNIKWMKKLTEIKKILKDVDKVLEPRKD